MSTMMTREAIDSLSLSEEEKRPLYELADRNEQLEREAEELKSRVAAAPAGRQPKPMKDRLARALKLKDEKGENITPARQQGTVAFVTGSTEVKAACVEVVKQDLSEEQIQQIVALVLWAYNQKEAKERAAALVGGPSPIFDDDDEE